MCIKVCDSGPHDPTSPRAPPSPLRSVSRLFGARVAPSLSPPWSALITHIVIDPPLHHNGGSHSYNNSSSPFVEGVEIAGDFPAFEKVRAAVSRARALHLHAAEASPTLTLAPVSGSTKRYPYSP